MKTKLLELHQEAAFDGLLVKLIEMYVWAPMWRRSNFFVFMKVIGKNIYSFAENHLLRGLPLKIYII